jgi:CO/xanthine dehydrogenase Mo-binding subunit
MAYSLLGKNFTPPDIHGKVTGRAKYAEDFRAEGMAFCKLLTSPVPHGRVTNIDATAALAMDGVYAVLTADELPELPAPEHLILTNEPMYVGAPILAVAAVDETTAENAVEQITYDLEPLPFTIDPLQSLYPGGPDARSEANAIDNYNLGSPTLQHIKWTARDFAAVEDGYQLPLGEPIAEWSFGDVDGGFERAALVFDETFVTASTAHHSMEPRTCMAYWENGKCFAHISSQSHTAIVPYLASMIGIETSDLIVVAETCGGGFGSKGNGYPLMALPAHLSRKIGRAVMLRISRAEEYANGSARHGFQGRVRLGFREDGRLLAADLYVVQENGATKGFRDFHYAGNVVTALYQPEAMRWRGLGVFTNTPPRGAQRGPGHNQTSAIMEPLMDKAARELGIDRLTIREVNAAPMNGLVTGSQSALSSCYMQDALAKGSEEFRWAERQAASGQRDGSKIRAVGIGQGYNTAGFSGYDGLVRVMPDGKLHIHTGVGNLGTYSHTATSRAAAEVLKCDWSNCVVERGDSRRHLPWNSPQVGSNTSFTQTRTNYVAAMDALAKIKEIAAIDLGGSPDDYDVDGERVFRLSDPDSSLTFATAAQRAIELGGKYDGHELPEDIHTITRDAAMALAGTGLVGVAKDNLELQGIPAAFVAGFVEIELDVETGKYEIIDYLAVADCGTVLHPTNLATQLKGGSVMGFGLGTLERHVYDPQNGLPANIGFVQAKPPSYLDLPAQMQASAVDLPDPSNPFGVKGVGEPPLGAAAAAVLCAISDAVGGHVFNRTPVTADQIVNHLSGRGQSHRPLQVNTS